MIFILGGFGFVGSAYVRFCEKAKIPFAIIDRQNYQDFVGLTCDVFINANGNSRKFFAKEDPLGDFHASVSSVKSSLEDFKFKKYVFLSTSDVYPNCSDSSKTREESVFDVEKQSTYGFHKYLAELAVKHSAEDWLIIRQGGFVGEGLKKNVIYDLLYGEKLWVSPESEFQFMDTNDSARLVMELIQKGVSNEVLNLTSVGTISVKTLMRKMGRKLLAVEGAQTVRYELMTEKVMQYLNLPETQNTIDNFLTKDKRGDL